MTKTFLAWVRGLPFWRPPHPAQPAQASLQKLLADVRRVQVRARGVFEGHSLSERILFVTDLPEDIQALGEALRIEDGSAEQCLCMLDTSILLFDGADRQLAAIGVHTCHRAIHWDHWKDDARLVDSWQLIDWRSSHGVPTFVSDDRIREPSLNRISDFLGTSLERVGRAIYSTADRGTSLTLAVSSRRPDASFLPFALINKQSSKAQCVPMQRLRAVPHTGFSWFRSPSSPRGLRSSIQSLLAAETHSGRSVSWRVQGAFFCKDFLYGIKSTSGAFYWQSIPEMYAAV